VYTHVCELFDVRACGMHDIVHTDDDECSNVPEFVCYVDMYMYDTHVCVYTRTYA
jgi:hypothetical protein